MYSDTPDVGKVTEAYTKYYQTHPFIKNKHTQYYKRWLRSISRTTALPSKEYLKTTSKNVKSSYAWEPRGPFDFDIDAASRSYAPGAAHIYCVEQSLSNADVIYAGTATAGLWRSNDKGEIVLFIEITPNKVAYSLEIDPTMKISSTLVVVEPYINLQMAVLVLLTLDRENLTQELKLKKL